jgi:hypothetical protein
VSKGHSLVPDADVATGSIVMHVRGDLHKMDRAPVKVVEFSARRSRQVAYREYAGGAFVREGTLTRQERARP